MMHPFSQAVAPRARTFTMRLMNIRWRKLGFTTALLAFSFGHAHALDPMTVSDERHTLSLLPDRPILLLAPVEATTVMQDGTVVTQFVSMAPAAPQNLDAASSIRDTLTAFNPNHRFARLPKRAVETVTAAYAARNFAPLWMTDGTWTPQARAVIDRLARADEDGLDTRDYPVHPLKGSGITANDLADSDIALTMAVLAYARDARGARIDLAKLSKLITPKLELPDAETVITALLNATDSGEALAKFNPPHAGYRLLKLKLATLRDITGSLASQPSLPAKPLRTTTAAVAQWPITASDVMANMERWRWLPQDLGERHIEVNLPAFSLSVVDHDQIIHRTRAIIGKAGTPTPLFSDRMVHLIVNPSWNVPYSIMKKEFLPKLAEDPDYATKAGYQISYNGDNVSIRQPPGARNALGWIKFMFPNEHSVYLHDTQTRNLFAEADRAYSHGCVRVEDPFALAAIVLDDPSYSSDRLKDLIGKGERLIKLKAPLPIHLTYFTLVSDENGNLRRLGDVYGYDQSVLSALGIGQTRTVAALH